MSWSFSRRFPWFVFGFRSEFSPDEFAKVVERMGIHPGMSIAGIVPASHLELLQKRDRASRPQFAAERRQTSLGI